LVTAIRRNASGKTTLFFILKMRILPTDESFNTGRMLVSTSDSDGSDLHSGGCL
jgi:hypothetical protein